MTLHHFWAHWLLWSLVSTIVLTTLMAAGQGLGLTRMSLPYLIGTVFTPDRDRAKAVGFLLHLAAGLLFALVYIAAFHAWGSAAWWSGGAIGLVHAAFLLAAALPLLPSVHPRMANEQTGPTATRQLEPPGFLGLHYGYQTPLVVVIAHVAYGMILGGFYRPN